MAESDPDLARAALHGLRAYEDAPRLPARPAGPVIAQATGAALRDCGGSGAPLVLIPSLINPPSILDLDLETSLARAIGGMGRRVLLLDWGPAGQRSGLDVGGHVERLLLPLLQSLGEPAALVGYCLGGTMALAAANLAPAERVVTLAAPWRFSGYPAPARDSLLELWRSTSASARHLGALPMEVLQAAFWSLDRDRTVAKFARFGTLDPASADARRFVALEDWANEGEPVPFPAAEELIERLFGADEPGRGEWRVGGRIVTDTPRCPVLNLVAAKDHIAPAATAPAGTLAAIASGHVGMLVGSKRTETHRLIADFCVAGRGLGG